MISRYRFSILTSPPFSFFTCPWCCSVSKAACRKAIISTLSNLQELCAEDEGLEKALREAVVVPDGGGELALISDLFDPAVDELQGLLAPEAFPTSEFSTPAVGFFLFVC